MKNNLKAAVVLATGLTIGLMGGAAHAAAQADASVGGPPDIFLGDVSGPGTETFDFHSRNVNGSDSSFFVTLAAGTYTFTADVSSDNTRFNKAWLSLSDDPFAHQANDLALFTPSPDTSKHDFGLASFTYTFTSDTTLYLNVDAKKDNKRFDGFLTVTSAVPEPASGALLLAGLGMMVFVGKRRRG